MKSDIYNLVGKTMGGRYLLTEFVDEGGMGIVYRADDSSTGKHVGIKILHPRFLITEKRSAYYLTLFHREGEILKKLRHPNILEILETGQQEDLVYIAMEWLEGEDLANYLASSGPVKIEDAALLLRQICLALSEAHRLKILHLDIKPANIFIINSTSAEPTIKIIDFGLSRIIQSTLGSRISRFLGTPNYMAPELFQNKASHLSDIYSLGVVMYEMLSGVLPYAATQIPALMNEHVTHPPPSIRRLNEEVPPLVDDLIRRTLSKMPKARPQTAADVYTEFNRALLKPPALTTSWDTRNGGDPFGTLYLDQTQLRPQPSGPRILHGLQFLILVILALLPWVLLAGTIFGIPILGFKMTITFGIAMVFFSAALSIGAFIASSEKFLMKYTFLYGVFVMQLVFLIPYLLLLLPLTIFLGIGIQVYEKIRGRETSI